MHLSPSHITRLLLALMATLLLAACANIGSPEGGPRDYQPPVVTKASPENGSVQFHGTQVRINFDEVVQLKDQQNKVVVSPAPKKQPAIKNLGKSIVVDFDEQLEPNTTYTIDFGDAIEDNNEGNRLDGYTFTFSTGDSIDTLRCSGMVLRARDLEPMQHVLVGVQSCLDDTAFSRVQLERICRTNDKGEFTLQGMKPGRYHIFALKDMDGDYKWNRTEDMAFLDDVVVPTVKTYTSQDTTFTFDHRVDTVVTQQHLSYLPNDVLLCMFNEHYSQLYLKKNERPQRNKLFIQLSAPTQLPQLRVLEPAEHAAEWCRVERNATNDSVFYWLTDSALIKSDSLRIEVTYLHSDSLDQLLPKTDTLKFNYRTPRGVLKAKADAEKEHEQRQKEIAKLLQEREKLVAKGKDPTETDLNIKALRAQDVVKPEPLGMTATMKTQMEVTDSLGFKFTTPVGSVNQSGIHLRKMLEDSTWTDVTLPPLRMADSLSLMHYVVPMAVEPEANYVFKVDSAAISDIYGAVNDSLEMKIKVKSLDDYGNIILHVNSGDSAFVQLLDGNDKVLRQQQVVNGTVSFDNLPPATYYARLIMDRNGNGKWDTGNYAQHLQPEEVYYYPHDNKLKVRKSWGREEVWDIYATPLNLQKSDKIKKNKPEQRRDSLDEGKNKKKNGTGDEEDEDDEFNSTGFGTGAYSSDKYRNYQNQQRGR